MSLKKVLIVFLFLSVLMITASQIQKHKVIPEKCVGCTLCVQACPVKAITMADKKAVIDPSKCVNCGLCSKKCRYSAPSKTGI